MPKHSIAKRLLRNREMIFNALYERRKKEIIFLTIQFLLIAVSGIYLYGVVMGTFQPDLDFWLLLGGKLLLVLIGSAVICLPTLYILITLSGSDRTLAEIVFLLLGMFAVIGLMLFGFVPIAWFFTLSVEHPGILTAMNLILIGLAVIFGIVFLNKAVRFFSKIENEKEKKVRGAGLSLFIWLVILLAVSLQMAYNIRPFFKESEGFAKVSLKETITEKDVQTFVAENDLERACGKGDKTCLGEKEGNEGDQKADYTYEYSGPYNSDLFNSIASDNRIIYCSDEGHAFGEVNSKKMTCYFTDDAAVKDTEKIAEKFNLKLVEDSVRFYDLGLENSREYFYVRIPSNKNDVKWIRQLAENEQVKNVEFAPKNKIDKSDRSLIAF